MKKTFSGDEKRGYNHDPGGGARVDPSSADYDKPDNQFSHDELLKSCREKASRYFLEAKFGSGATSSREYMIRPLTPKACVLCGSKKYTCLGKGCTGLNCNVIVTGQIRPNILNHGGIPGKVFKTTRASEMLARNPETKKSILQKLPARKLTPKKVKKHAISSGSSRKGTTNKSGQISIRPPYPPSPLNVRSNAMKMLKPKIDFSCKIRLTRREWSKILWRKTNIKQNMLSTEERKLREAAERVKMRTINNKPMPLSEVPCRKMKYLKPESYASPRVLPSSDNLEIIDVLTIDVHPVNELKEKVFPLTDDGLKSETADSSSKYKSCKEYDFKSETVDSSFKYKSGKKDDLKSETVDSNSKYKSDREDDLKGETVDSNSKYKSGREDDLKGETVDSSSKYKSGKEGKSGQECACHLDK